MIADYKYEPYRKEQDATEAQRERAWEIKDACGACDAESAVNNLSVGLSALQIVQLSLMLMGGCGGRCV